MKTVSIFGCGWIGKALLPLLENEYKVFASVQSQKSFDTLECQNRYILNETNNYFTPKFYDSNTLIIAIPPRGNYLEIIQTLCSYIKPSTQIILLSSTSVYPQKEGNVLENDTKNVENPSLMLESERFLQKNHQKTLILRLSGLMGYSRIAGKYTAGKTLEHDALVNYIHRDDVVAIIKMFIDNEVSEDVINVSAPLNPSKKTIYDNNAALFGFEKTHFKSLEAVGKTVSCEKLQETYHYQFLKENPLTFW